MLTKKDKKKDKNKEMPDFERAISVYGVAFLASGIVGEPVINWFNDINPWLVLEEPALISFLFFVFIVVCIRRKFFNVVF